MSRYRPEEHASLAAFLRQHRPLPPAAHPHVEDALMAQIEAMPHPVTAKKPWLRGAIAATLAAVASATLLWVWLGQTRSQDQLVLTATEREELERFILSSLSDPGADESLPLDVLN